jgi:phage tail sheath gpL-like
VVLDAAAVGAYASTNPSNFVDAAGAAVAAPVQSVNGATGTVTLDAQSVGAIGTAVGLYVEDYSSAPTVRPVAAAVYWRGTAAPGTAVASLGDLWLDTTGG